MAGPLGKESGVFMGYPWNGFIPVPTVRRTALWALNREFDTIDGIGEITYCYVRECEELERMLDLLLPADKEPTASK